MRVILLFMSLVLLVSCSYIPGLNKVFPDKRNEYTKSQSLPALEVPPDLTADSINDSMAIPNEGSATLSGYQRSRLGAGVQQIPEINAPDGEQWLVLKGAPVEIWPKLRQYFNGRGYELELDDFDLGVLETAWSEPVVEDGVAYRHRFSLFSEQGGAPGHTVLYLSSKRQEQRARADASLEWVDLGKSSAREKRLADDLRLLLDAVSMTDAAASAAARSEASLTRTDDGRLLLTIPEEFTRAWRRVDESLNRSGFTIDGKDVSKGLFFINYFDADAEQKKSWLSNLKFWGSDETTGVPYRISLIGVGKKTELIVLNEEGNWESNADAEQILASIKVQYNRQGRL